MSRIELKDTITNVIVKMAEGNPGAISTIMAILEQHDKIDPQATIGGIGVLLLLDTYEIYGTDIYVLFNDKCNRDVRQMLMLLRATQLGLFSSDKLKEMAYDQMGEINLTDDEWNALDDKVCDRLSDFQRVV